MPTDRAGAGMSPFGATLVSLLFLVAPQARIPVSAKTAGSQFSVPVSTHPDQGAHDHEPSPNTHAAPASLNNHDAESGVSPAGSDRSDAHGDRGEHENPLHQPEERTDADGHGHGSEEETPLVHLSPEQRRTLGLEITELVPRALEEALRAPGEVRLNTYATAQVTPRIDAQVMARHARLGDSVEEGQPLVSLSSVEMAEAQGDLVVAEREWQRLTKLKGQFVSETDYLAASVARQKALSRVLAYGMTRAEADALVAATSEKADGSFELLAPRAGTVVRDAFLLGELVEPGRVLFEITDESVRWVQVRMPPEEAALVSIGDLARVAYRGDWLDGRVSQIHHLLDEGTRTQAVRLEVPDPAHRLHPGVFVDAVILIGEGAPVLAVPEAAVLRGPDGDWRLFVAAGEGVFRPVEVELLRTTGGMAVIEGIAAGTRVVTRGAFFLQSELAKGGFDPHNH